jgi:hypothetical protein
VCACQLLICACTCCVCVCRRADAHRALACRVASHAHGGHCARLAQLVRCVCAALRCDLVVHRGTGVGVVMSTQITEHSLTHRYARLIELECALNEAATSWLWFERHVRRDALVCMPSRDCCCRIVQFNFHDWTVFVDCCNVPAMPAAVEHVVCVVLTRTADACATLCVCRRVCLG